ncbi:MAG: membrane protein insertase YidC [Bacteroidales bacterium]|nr:membrane protein insertase YidC [Bacteroidales bacterium]
MNKNTIIGLLLIFGLMIGYSLWFAPEPPESEGTKSHDTSQVQKKPTGSDISEKREKDVPVDDDTIIDKKSEDQPETVESKTEPDKLPSARKGSFAHASKGSPEFYNIENEVFKLKFSTEGGRIAQVKLRKFDTYDSLPVKLFTPDSSQFFFEFYNNEQEVISTGDYYFEPVWYGSREDKNMNVTGDDSLRFGMRLYANNPDSVHGVPGYIEYIYTIRGNKYMVDMDVEFHDLQQALTPIYANIVNLTWRADLRQQEKSQKSVMGGGSTIYYRDNVGDVEDLNEREDDEENISTGLEWIAFKQRFFNSMIWTKDQSIESAKLKSYTKVEETDPELHYLKSMEAQMTIAYEVEKDNTANFAFYFGPNEYQRLKKYDIDMEEMIPLGWGFFLLHWINRFAVIPVFNYLEGFNLGYGIIILILTILLKTILFPIAYKTYRSSAKMRVLRPEVEEINKKYPKKENAMKKQQATMALYKKAGVNPMAGCLPMLLQLPILIAMFRFFPSSIELRGQGFLWAHDLSTYDSVLSLPFDIPFYGDHVSLFTLLMAISTVLYTWVNQQNMNTGQQMPGMKTMMYFMPVMLLFIFNNYASGLSYYYFLANIITFIQMIVIRRFIDEDAIRAKIQANKKKPVKKSKFQQRLEEASKQQKQRQKRR